MKLKVFDEITLPKLMMGRRAIPAIRITEQGVLNINPSGARLMELQSGDKISIAQNECDPDNWYLYKDAMYGFELRQSTDGNRLQLSHKKMQEEIVKYFKLEEHLSHGFLIAGTPTLLPANETKYWGLILRKK